MKIVIIIITKVPQEIIYVIIHLKFKIEIPEISILPDMFVVYLTHSKDAHHFRKPVWHRSVLHNDVIKIIFICSFPLYLSFQVHLVDTIVYSSAQTSLTILPHPLTVHLDNYTNFMQALVPSDNIDIAINVSGGYSAAYTRSVLSSFLHSLFLISVSCSECVFSVRI